MRYAQRGGYTPAEQQRREQLRMEAAGRFARGDGIGEIARDLRVTESSVRRWQRVGFQNSATGPDLGFYAARSYSLMRPPRTGRRLIRSLDRSAAGWSGRGGRSSRLRWGRRPL